ncbi:MAG: glycoside hydrolase family 30 protein [Eubacteriales bacterium]|nr:glycoside hydrolase family 30 protein [Eubacteriales bacterium]
MKKIQCVVTAKDTGYRLSYLDNIIDQSENDKNSNNVNLIINPKEKKQKVIGFGGAFTEASAVALAGVDNSLKSQAIKAYFDPKEGIAYNLCRTPIGASDFSQHIYSYDDTENDIELIDFSVRDDSDTIIPMIHRAMQLQNNLFIYATPWSPPAWMKTNRMMTNGGKLREEFRSVYAKYLVRFIDEYKKNGIDLWGLSIQNEPVEIQEWPSCCYSAKEEADFIKNYLIPELEKYKRRDLKILLWDCNKDILYNRIQEEMSILQDNKSIFSVAFHWYSGDYFEELDALHEEYPKLELISTESCVPFCLDIKKWDVAEKYAHEIIGDFNHWTNGYIDWNLFLDEKGGPNLANNYCLSPIILDRDHNELIYLPAYFYIGHFSKFIERDAVVLGRRIVGDIESCAFIQSNGEIVVVIMNKYQCENVISFHIDGEKEFYKIRLLPHSIVTLLINKEF